MHTLAHRLDPARDLVRGEPSINVQDQEEARRPHKAENESRGLKLKVKVPDYVISPHDTKQPRVFKGVPREPQQGEDAPSPL